MLTLLFILACIGVHRLWNFEAIFTSLRSSLMRIPGTKFALCHACNAFWICLLLALLVSFGNETISKGVLLTFAGYALVRGQLWLYQAVGWAEAWLRRGAIGGTVAGSSARTPPAPEALTRTPASAGVTPPCASCADKKAVVLSDIADAKTFERRVVLLTTLGDFSPSYSLTSVILDQARMLAMNSRWLVQIWVHEGVDPKTAPADLPSNVRIMPIVPRIRWRNDVIDETIAPKLAASLRQHLMRLGSATVITHDVLFQASYSTLAAAVWRISDTPAFAWLHVCHSAAATVRPTGGEAVRLRTNLPEGHRLLCLNEAEKGYLAAYYGTDESNILVCPNARDVISFGQFDSRATTLARKHGLHLAEIVQVYPLSATRLAHKGAHKVADIFAKLSGMGFDCRLVLATAHANGPDEQKALAELRAQAVAAGLPSEHLVITSEEFPDTAAQGLSQATIRSLFGLSNVFVFPTISEACSLVLAEAAISGCLLVTNASLHTTGSIPGLSFRFGSIRAPGDFAPSGTVADAIRASLDDNQTDDSRRIAMRTFSFEHVGKLLRDAVESTPPMRMTISA